MQPRVEPRAGLFTPRRRGGQAVSVNRPATYPSGARAYWRTTDSGRAPSSRPATAFGCDRPSGRVIDPQIHQCAVLATVVDPVGSHGPAAHTLARAQLFTFWSLALACGEPVDR